MANIQETITEVEKLNPELARQIRKYVKEHSYGLVFEQNLPEAVRLYKKTPAVNDVVNILPERGKEKKDENKVAWVVKELNNGIATLIREDESKEVPVEDIVTLVSYKDVIYPGLKEIDRVERGNPDDPYHMVINSENYHALEALTYAYAGQVDCIYIDPPYNKQDSKDWKYNCDYVDGNDQYRHSKWLAFMERRLKIAKKLLNPNDSMLIIAIDEVEYARLALLLEQLFPESEIDMITTVVNPRGKQRTGRFSKTEEYVFFVKMGEATIHQENDTNTPGVTNISWRTMRRSSLAQRRGNHGYGSVGPNQFYPVYVSDEGKIVDIGDPLPENQSILNFPSPEGVSAVFPLRDDGTEMNWAMTNTTAKEMLQKGYIRVGRHTPRKPQSWELSYLLSGVVQDVESGRAIVMGKNSDGSIIAVYVEERKKSPSSVWVKSSHNAETEGTNLLKTIFGNDKRFPYPKSLYAVADCLRYYVDDKPNALIVDFFGGSGTTLHAVNLLNAEDGGKRRCIVVTNNEASEDEEKEFSQKGLRPSDPDWEKYGIANYVTWQRTKCSIEGVDVNGNPLDGDYGCSIEDYVEMDADVIDPETGKKIRGKVYKKAKSPVYPELAEIKKADGFKANAIFCELTYESAWPIRLDRAFDAIAPMLWMLAGCQGPIIKRIGKSYLTTDYYGVLFDYGQASKFCDAVKKKPNIKNVFVVTDDQRRYSNMCKRLPGIRVHRLYESFLRTFEICGEGGLD